MKIEPYKTYRIGILTPAGEKAPDSIIPEFKMKPKAVSISGQNLISLGCDTFDDYFRINPHKFPIDSTVRIYEYVPEGGGYKLVSEANPIPKERTNIIQGNNQWNERGNFLGDSQIYNPNSQFLNQNQFSGYAQQSYGPPQPVSHSKDVIEELKSLMKVQNETISALNIKIEELRTKLTDEQRKGIEIETEKEKYKAKFEILEGQVTQMIEKGGLGPKSGLMDALPKILENLSSHPGIGDKVDMLLDKIMGGGVPQAQPPAKTFNGIPQTGVLNDSKIGI